MPADNTVVRLPAQHVSPRRGIAGYREGKRKVIVVDAVTMQPVPEVKVKNSDANAPKATRTYKRSKGNTAKAASIQEDDPKAEAVKVMEVAPFDGEPDADD